MADGGRASPADVKLPLSRAADLPSVVTAALVTHDDPYESLAAALSCIAQSLDRSAQLWSVDAANEALRLLLAWPPPAGDESAVERFLVRGEGLAGRVWECGRLSEDSASNGLAAPVRCAGQVVGVLCLFSPVGDRVELAAPLSAVCAQLANYLESYRYETLARELAQAQRNLARVASLVQDNVWIVEMMRDGTVRSVFASSDGREVFGGRLPRSGDMAQMMAAHIDPRDQREFWRYHEALAAGRPAQMQTRVIGVDGVTRWVWTRATPRREGDRLFVDGISTNVTEQREVAQERERLLRERDRQVKRLREIDRMRDELVAVVSHELRNPVATIRGCLELMEGQDPLTRVIDRQTQHMEALVNDLLTLAEVEAGLPQSASIDDVAELVRCAIDDHRVTAQTAEVRLRADISAELPALIDRVRIRQVLNNLLSNALKYTPAGGEVTVTAGRRDNKIVIAVADTGIGIAPEDYPHLFTRFFRTRAATTRGIKGTGLGLAIVRAIMRSHHGDVSAFPRDGGGTIFQLTLPGQHDPQIPKVR